MEILSRREAAVRGLTLYYTGKVCSRGHRSERFVSTGNCKECGKTYNVNFRIARNTALIMESRGLKTVTVKVPRNRELELVLLANSMLLEAGKSDLNAIPELEKDAETLQREWLERREAENKNIIHTVPRMTVVTPNPDGSIDPHPIARTAQKHKEREAAEREREANRKAKDEAEKARLAHFAQIAETRRQMEVLTGVRDPLTWLNGLGDPT